MDAILTYLFVFVVGVTGSFIGAVAAGAALITVPGLLLLGLPPHIALATSRFGGFGFKLSSLFNYLKNKIVIWDLVLPWSILGILGGTLGARILVEVDAVALEKLVGILLLALLPFFLLKKGIGTEHRNISKQRRSFSHLLYFINKVWSGFFSPGSGFFATYIALNAYRITILEAKGTSRIPDILTTISVVSVFAWSGLIDYKIGIILFLGMFVGGYIGSHVAIKKGDVWIKPIMAIFITIVSIKLIFF